MGSLLANGRVQRLQWEERVPSPEDDEKLVAELCREDMDLKHWASFLCSLRAKRLRIKPNDSHSLLIATTSAMRRTLPPSHSAAKVTEASSRRAMRVARGLASQSIRLKGEDDLASSFFMSSFEALTLPLLGSAGVPELALMAEALVKLEAKPSQGWVGSLVKRSSDALSSFQPVIHSRTFRVPWRALKIPLGRISRFNLPRSARQQRAMTFRPSYHLLFLRLRPKPLPRLISAHINLAFSSSILLTRSRSISSSESDSPSCFPTIPQTASYLNHLPTSTLPPLIWAIAVLVNRDRRTKREWVKPWSEEAATALHERMSSINDPQSLIHSLHALLLLQLKPYDAWLRDMERKLCELLTCNEINAEDLQRLLWCYGQLKRKPDYALTTRIEYHLSRALPKMQKNEMAVVHSQLMEIFCPRIRDKKLQQTLGLMNTMLKR